jgi:VanZ family protein
MSSFPWLPQRLLRVALILTAVAVLVLALLPGPEVPITTSWDKLDHWFAFFTLSLLADHSFPQQSFWRRLAPCLLAYGIGIELLQWLTPDRDAEALDVLADGISIASYGLLRCALTWVLRPSRAD